MIKKQLGRRICQLRKGKGLTQEQLAELTEYSVEFVSFIERGINGPSVEGLARIANALGVEVMALFDFKKTDG